MPINNPSAASHPGGVNTDIQYNNSGVFGGASGIHWDESGLALNTSAQTTLQDEDGNLAAYWDTTTRLLFDENSQLSIQFNSRSLYDDAGIQTLTWYVGAKSLIDDIGVNAIRWDSRSTQDASGIDSSDWNSRILFDSTPVASLSWNARKMTDTSGNLALEWASRGLFDASVVISADWGNRGLFDSSSSISVDWENKRLYGFWTIDAIASEIIVRKTTDETVTGSSTLQDDDEVYLPINANEVWQFEIVAFGKVDSALEGIKASVNGPAGNYVSYNVQIFATDTLSKSIQTQAYGTSVGALVVGANVMIYIKGYVDNGGTGGFINFQWAQQTAGANNTKILKGSYIKGTKIA